jgi:hypothetical protein
LPGRVAAQPSVCRRFQRCRQQRVQPRQI